MKSGVIREVFAISVVLIMVVSCMTPCIAVDNSTNNISGDDVTLEGTSYIIVHALNPEAIEIASIEGMDPYCVLIYDGDILIGYGAHDNETYNKPIAISPSAHTIKVKFNGLTMEQVISLNEGETQTLIFTFTRIEKSISETIDFNGYTDVTKTETVPSHSSQYVTAQAWYEPPSYPNPLVGTRISVYCYNPGDIPVDVKVSARGELYANYPNYRAIISGEGFILTPPLPGAIWYASLPHTKLSGGNLVFCPRLFPTYNGFDYWYIQNYSPVAIFGVYIWLDKVIGETIVDRFEVPIHFFDAGYKISTLSTSRDFNALTLYHMAEYDSYHEGAGYAENEIVYPPNLKISSIPYDLLGTGIICEAVKPPIASFTYSPENPEVGEEITFDASSSYDPDGEIVKYEWNFGDGNSTEGKVVTYAYSKAGNYTVTLTVTDNDGLQGSTSKVVEVKPIPVILIHGLLSEPSTWNTMKERLESEGYTVDVWDYAPGPETATGNINVYAKRLKNHIESDYKDAEKIDIVAHSMGGLITRAYLKNEDGKTKIRKFIMIGTPNNGSELCYLIDDDTLEILKHFPEKSFIQDFARMVETGPAFEQLTPGSDFLLWLNHDFTHLANTEVHTIAGTDDTWNDYEYTFNHPWLGDITIEAGRIYQQLVEPLLVGSDDSVVRVNSVGKVGIIPSEYHAAHTWRNPELEHDGIINEVMSILGSKPQKHSQDKIIGAASAESTNVSIQYVFTDSNTLSMGEEKKYNIPVSFTDDVSFLVGWDYGDLNLTLTTPSGNSINSTINITNITYFYYYNETTGGIQGFNITNPEEGDWEIDLVAQFVPELNYTIITFANSSLTLSITAEKSICEPEEHISLSSLLTNGDTPVIDASIEAEIKKPDGYTEPLIMYDDGNHNDDQANDGIYGNVFTNTSLLGRYSITAYASSGDFVRESVSRVIWVEQYPDLTLTSSDICFSNNLPFAGDNITINATIHNIGEANATNATILFYDGNSVNGTTIGEDVVNVSVNATANASVSWIAKAGVREIYVLISPYNEFLEKNYTNNQAFKSITVAITNVTFDTGSPSNPYPSIFGTHNGTITPIQTIIVSKLYTYPCAGTGGHTEYAALHYSNGTLIAEAHWNGYVGDWHNISFNKTFTLVAGEIYNYTIKTGSYPQIHHTDALPTTNGWINNTQFTDTNGKVYPDWIPAIRLWRE